MRRLILWMLSTAAAAMFLFAGTLKLAGVPMQVEVFAAIGIGQWFRYLTGALEVAGAIGLVVPATAPIAALTLAAVMLGATATHLFILGGSPLPALLLFAIVLTVAYLRREQFSSRVLAA